MPPMSTLPNLTCSQSLTPVCHTHLYTLSYTPVHIVTHLYTVVYTQGSYTQLAIKFKGFQGFFKGFQVAIFKGNPVYNSLAFFTEPVKQRVNHSIQGCLHVIDHE